MIQVAITVNGKVRKAHVEPRTLLVHFLREHLNLTGTHVGCDTSQCGACTVLIGDIVRALDGAAVTAPEDLLDLLTGSRVGQTATLHLIRGGSPADVTVTIGARPS